MFKNMVIRDGDASLRCEEWMLLLDPGFSLLIACKISSSEKLSTSKSAWALELETVS